MAELFSAMVADAAPPDLRGTAFGVYYAASGTATLVGSAAAGGLWDWLGPPAPFLAAAAVALLALALIPFAMRR